MSEQYMEVDSTDVKFNETFLPCRERKGKLASGAIIEPDLQTDPSNDKTEIIENTIVKFSDEVEIVENNHGENNAKVEVIDYAVETTEQQYGRGKIHPVQRQFFSQALAQITK